MALFGAVRSPFLLRRLLVELRGIRRALERQADVAELQAQHTPRPGSQSFRSFSRERTPTNGEGSEVSYPEPAFLALAEARRGELQAFLGRDPTDQELERAIAGDVE